MNGAKMAMVAAIALALYEAVNLDWTGAAIMLACYYVASLLNGEPPPA